MTDADRTDSTEVNDPPGQGSSREDTGYKAPDGVPQDLERARESAAKRHAKPRGMGRTETPREDEGQGAFHHDAPADKEDNP